MKSKKVVFLIVIIVLIIIGAIVFAVKYNKPESAEDDTDVVDKKIENVQIIDYEISNESLIDEFIENSENNVSCVLKIEVSSETDNDLNKSIKLEFVPGIGDTQESNGIATTTRPQDDEDYKNFYGYYIYTIDDEEVGEYDALRYELKRGTEEGIVELYFDTEYFDYAEKTIICEYTLESSNYEKKFILNYYETQSVETVNQIAEEGEFDNTDFEVYVYLGDVEIIVDEDEVYDFKQALENEVITVNEILEQAEMDILYGICEKGYYSDGGSTEYYYDDYTILKYNTLDGNNDLVIGPAGSFINDLNDADYKGASNIGESCSEVDGVSMTIMSGTITKTSATIIITEDGNESHGYGAWFRIDKKENGTWKKLDIPSDYAFITVAYGTGADGILELKQDWEDLYGELESGTYRLVKEVDDKYFWVEFTID